MIRPDRLTIKGQEAFRDAMTAARERGNPVVNDAHLFAASPRCFVAHFARANPTPFIDRPLRLARACRGRP